MEELQVLDNEFKKASIPKVLLRWQWHLKHAGIVIGLHLIMAYCLAYILPYLPSVLSDLLSFLFMFLIIFGTCFITGYVCRVGYQWNWGLVLLAAGFIFLSCFIYTMSTLDYWLEFCSPKLQAWTSMSDREIKNFLDIFLVGLIYSCVVIVVIEILTFVAIVLVTLYRLVKKE